MIVFFGWGKKAKRLANAGIDKCVNCRNWSPMGVYARSSAVSLYFVSVAKWGTKFYLVCDTCDAGIEVDADTKTKLLRASADLPPTAEMKRIWAEIDERLTQYLAEPQKEGVQCRPALDFVIEAMTQKHNPSHIDYVASRFAACAADPDVPGR